MGRRFGRLHEFEISSPAEALRALRANHGRPFAQYLFEMREAPFRIYIGDEIADLQRMTMPVGPEPIRIVPVIQGGKDAFWGILAGALLIIFAGPIGQALGGQLIAASTITTIAAGIGWSLVLGGVAQLLFKPPELQNSDRTENQPSFAFNGAVNTVAQGNPVPVGYGRLIVGSQVISLGLHPDAMVP